MQMEVYVMQIHNSEEPKRTSGKKLAVYGAVALVALGILVFLASQAGIGLPSHDSFREMHGQ